MVILGKGRPNAVGARWDLQDCGSRDPRGCVEIREDFRRLLKFAEVCRDPRGSAEIAETCRDLQHLLRLR